MDSEVERLLQSGLVQDFVKKKGGQWNHQDWLAFLDSVRSAGYQILSDDQIGLLLEQEKAKINRMTDGNVPAMIGNVRVLLALNQKAIDLLRSEGVEWPAAICYFMAKNSGSRSELEISSDRVTLSMVSKVRCQTTPMYRDKMGCIYVLFEELNHEAKLKEGLEFLGTIDPKRYAAALCARLGIVGKTIYV